MQNHRRKQRSLFATACRTACVHAQRARGPQGACVQNSLTESACLLLAARLQPAFGAIAGCNNLVAVTKDMRAHAVDWQCPIHACMQGALLLRADTPDAVTWLRKSRTTHSLMSCGAHTSPLLQRRTHTSSARAAANLPPPPPPAQLARVRAHAHRCLINQPQLSAPKRCCCRHCLQDTCASAR
jgi:hypothetical protein